MPNQHLDPNSINLTYGHPDGVPAPEPYSWKKALTVANAVWLAQYNGKFRLSHARRTLAEQPPYRIAYHKSAKRQVGTEVHELADQIFTPEGPGPNEELLAQYPQLREAPFTLPLQAEGAYWMVERALTYEAECLWNEIYTHAKNQGVPWWKRNGILPGTDLRGLGIRLNRQQLKSSRQKPTPIDVSEPHKIDPSEPWRTYQMQDFILEDGRYLARLIIKHHLNHEYKEGALKNG